MPANGMRLSLVVMVVVCVVLAGCTPTPLPTPDVTPTPAGPTPAPPEARPWWFDVVFYEVFVRSFYDSDGDGTGDFAGLTEKLDYLNDGDPDTMDDLGVGGLWLMPVTEGYSYHGYDVVDYGAVESDYGDVDAFRGLVEAAHARGMRVIVDLVLNHTSSQHPWFISSQDSDSVYRSWYVWQDEDPGFAGPDGQRVWYPNPDGDGFYYALFWEEMPDLNYREDAVTAAMQDASRFWLDDLGVDGFRLDAVKHLVEEGETQVHTAATHTWLASFDDFTDGFLTGEGGLEVLTVGELWDATRLVAPYVTGDEVDLAFEFDLAGAIVAGVKAGDPAWLGHVLEQVEGVYPDHAYAPFLTNHDQNRVMSQLRGDGNRAKLAASILLTLPGVPFVYYGEEIGMTGVKPDEQIRTPMQWTADPHAGFTTGEPWMPVNEDYPAVNVEAQSGDPKSLLSHYRRLIQLRAAEPALRHGAWVPVAAACKAGYGYLRHLTGEAPVLVLFNFDDAPLEPCAFSLDASALDAGETVAQDGLTGAEFPGPTLDDRGGFSGYVPKATLAPGESLILVVK